MIGPQCHVTVSICIMQLIQNFIRFCSKEKRMILAAKLFPILNRRFDDLDLRVSRQEPIRIFRNFCSSFRIFFDRVGPTLNRDFTNWP